MKYMTFASIKDGGICCRFFVGLLLYPVCNNDVIAQNLVPNPSFESNSCIPNGFSNSASDYNSCVVNWQCPTSATPDYHHSSSGNPDNDVPVNFFGNQAARTGSAYSGIFTYDGSCSNWREYLKVQLTSPLVSGNSYYVRMYVSLGDECSYKTNNLGFFFTTSANPSVGSDCGGPNRGVMSTAGGQLLNNTTVQGDFSAWTLISFTFTAGGNYSYLFVGNFYNDAATTRQFGPSLSIPGAYYYIEDVCVGSNSGNCGILPVVLAYFKGSYIYDTNVLEWATSSESNNDYFIIERSVDGRDFSATGAVKAAGNSASPRYYTFTDGLQSAHQRPGTSAHHYYYRLKQVDYNDDYTYSETVKVNPDVPQELAIAGIYTSGGVSEIRITMPSAGEVMYEIQDIAGNRALFGNLGHMPAGSHTVKIPAGSLPAGIYCLILSSGRETATGRIIIY